VVDFTKLEYWTSLDPTVRPVPKGELDDFNLTLDGKANTRYYLSLKKKIGFLGNTETFSDITYPFYLTKPAFSEIGFWNYWARKRVNAAALAGTWQNEMYKIINGKEPMFFLIDHSGSLVLVDGLRKWEWDHGLGPRYGLSGPYNPLQMSGDYPPRRYIFKSKLMKTLPLTLTLTLRRAQSEVFIVQNASGLRGNMDAAMSALVSSMSSHNLKIFKTSATPSGIIGADDIVIIKVNGQSTERGHTNTDLVESVIKIILNHPDGFSGEIVLADNGQNDQCVNMSASNAFDHTQSITNVASHFPTHKVSACSWWAFADQNVGEYSNGDYNDGYVVNYTPDPVTNVKVSYPKFKTAYGNYISFKNGVWNQSTLTYNPSTLKVINLPMFKSHYNYGATACVKNYMGVGSRTLTAMHDNVGDGGMGTEMVQTRFPSLNIIDGIWINANPFQPGDQTDTTPCGPFTYYNQASYTDVIGASIDPVALEYWIAKHVAMPAAAKGGYSYISSIDPDYEPITQNLTQSYHHYLVASSNEITKTGRKACMNENDVAVYLTDLYPKNPPLPFKESFGNLNSWTTINGTWVPINGGVQGSGPLETLMVAGCSSWTNYGVSAKLRAINSNEASLVVRFKGPTDFYWMGLGCWGNKYSISKVVNGICSKLVSSGDASEIAPGVSYTVSAIAMDGWLQLLVDGTEVLKVEDYSIPNGSIGLRTYGATMQAEELIVK
jgi:hypothetical protein